MECIPRAHTFQVHELMEQNICVCWAPMYATLRLHVWRICKELNHSRLPYEQASIL